MSFFQLFRKSTSEAEQLERLVAENKRLVEENERLAAASRHAGRLLDEVEEFKARIQSEHRSATPAVSFERMRAFSIERMHDDQNGPSTVIGYYGRDDEVREWSLWCSIEHHEQLVKQFQLYRDRIVS